jgi:polysaccharide export outer membrane protein
LNRKNLWDILAFPYLEVFMVSSKVFLLIFSFFLLTFSAFAQVPSPTVQGYLIGPGDVLSIKALGESTFDVDSLTVDEDGKISIPYVDLPLTAKCKTERGLQAEVSKAWSKYLKNPQISLRVTKRESRLPVSVFGEVRVPSRFDLTRRVRLLELISYAGGESEKSGGMVQVIRSVGPICSISDDQNNWTASDGSAPMRQFSLADVRLGRDEANPEIIAGDVILVLKASPIYVIGEVMRPGEFVLPDEGLPLTQAIAMASGVNREAKTKSIKVYRQKPGSKEPEVFSVNYDQIRKGVDNDIMLKPRDIIEVGKAPKSIMDYVVEFATGIPNRIPIRPL